MKTKNKILIALTVLPLIITAVVLKFMPERIPAHYDAAGNIDRWGSKYESFVLPGIIILMTLFWFGIIKYYENKQKKSTDEKVVEESSNNAKVLYYVADSMAVMFGVMQCFFLYSAYTASVKAAETSIIDINIITCVCMGLMFIVIGNILPKAKLNSLLGVRTVWSMHNDQTWAVSNRFGGLLLVGCGILTIVSALIVGGKMSIFVMLGLLVVCTIIITVYTYFAYKRYK